MRQACWTHGGGLGLGDAGWVYVNQGLMNHKPDCTNGELGTDLSGVVGFVGI